MGHENLCFFEVSDTYLLGCLRYREKHVKYILIAVGVCCCLQIFNSVVNMQVMGLVLGQSLMVIPTKCYPLMSRSIYLPIIMYCDVCCCLHVK